MVWLFGPRRITRRVMADDPPSCVMVALELPRVLVVVDTPVGLSAVSAVVQPARASRTPSRAKCRGVMEASYAASLCSCDNATRLAAPAALLENDAVVGAVLNRPGV